MAGSSGDDFSGLHAIKTKYAPELDGGETVWHAGKAEIRIGAGASDCRGSACAGCDIVRDHARIYEEHAPER